MITLRDYQHDAVDSIFNYFKSRKGNPIVAMPTATGKSVVIASFLHRALTQYPQCKFLMLTHVKELIEQNARKIQEIWPTAPIGINSAALKQRDYHQSIICGGIASVRSDADKFGFIDILLIDECHLLSPNAETMYQKFIGELRKYNPRLKIVGFTATAFRLKQGSLTDEGLFTDICYDLTAPDAFVHLIANGYLAPVYPFATQTQIDMTGVSVAGGEFNLAQLDAAVDKPAVMVNALKEIAKAGRDRRRWLIFNTGITNAEHTAEILNGWGIPCGVVHSRLDREQRDRVLRDFHNGTLRAVSNNNVLTTGYDEPGIDLIGMLRPTKSPGLWVQMAGRGMRVAPWEGKRDCILLDFAGNRARLGPINDPILPNRPTPSGSHDAPVKVCAGCGVYNHASARNCEYCGLAFPVVQSLQAVANTNDIMRMPSSGAIVKDFDVTSMTCHSHVKKSTGERMLRCTYYCGLKPFFEYIKIETGSERVVQWWGQRTAKNLPATVDEALEMQSDLRCPRSIRVWMNAKDGFPQIMGYQW